LCIVQANATWDRVAPMSAATLLTTSAMARLLPTLAVVIRVLAEDRATQAPSLVPASGLGTRDIACRGDRSVVRPMLV
jgi:hypothetical protein